MHNLYRITNKTNNKTYIGQSVNAKQRLDAHKSAAKTNKPTQVIHHALIKYGVENFEFEVIASCLNQLDTDYIEEELIKQYKSLITENGYNISRGGMTSAKTDEWKQKLSEIHKCKHNSPETEFKEGHPQYNTGRTHFKKGHSTYNKGLPPEQQPRYGAKLTEEHINKLIEGNKKKRKLTEEQVKYIRENKHLGPVALGRMYNISEASIRDILNYITYKN